MQYKLLEMVLYGWSNPRLSDLSPIANLTQLTSLLLAACSISDITPLADLTQLEELNVGYNVIENIEPLANLTQLIHLRLTANRIVDITPLANLTLLTELLLHQNRIVDVRPLAKLNRLERLQIDNNQITDFSPLAGLVLTEFTFDEVCLIDASPVEDRIENRSYPSLFQPWSDITNLSDLSKSERIALHDLYIGPSFKLHFRETQKGYQLIGNLGISELERYELNQLNPNIIVFAEIAVRDNWPDTYPEDWPHWIRDEDGNRVSAINYPAFLVDFTHPEVQNIIVEQAAAVRKCGLYDGIFLDWWKEGHAVLRNDFSKQSHRTNEAEQRARDIIIERIREAVGDDFLIIVNPNRDKPRRTAPYINGLFMETGQDYPGGYTHEGLQDIEDTLLWAEDVLREPRINALEGEGIGALPPDNPENLRNMRLFTTLSLTHSDGYLLYNKGSRAVDPSLPHHGHIWTDFWDAELGQPVGGTAETYRNIEGLFIREFTNGWAVYNRSGKARQIQLPENVSGVASDVENKRWHDIPDLDGEIYLKATEVRSPAKVANLADVNGDGLVNVLDLVATASAFGKTSPDLNGDGVVNILDLVIVANAFGSTSNAQ